MKRTSIGWREWIALPDLGIERLKAKIDTGARTSALHTFEVQPFYTKGISMVRFWVHPVQRNNKAVKECVHPVHDIRWVSDSGGHREKRYVIHTMVKLGSVEKSIEITLTNRDTMLFRFLLGRTALHRHFVVKPDKSFLLGGKPSKQTG